MINRDPNSHLIAQLRKEIGGLRTLLRESGIYTTLSAPRPPPAGGGASEEERGGFERGGDREGSSRAALLRAQFEVLSLLALPVQSTAYVSIRQRDRQTHTHTHTHTHKCWTSTKVEILTEQQAVEHLKLIRPLAGGIC